MPSLLMLQIVVVVLLARGLGATTAMTGPLPDLLDRVEGVRLLRGAASVPLR
jgi:hypothetical protein